MTRVLVTSAPTAPDWPVFGMVMPFSAGWLRTLSGVSPCGTCQRIVPLLTSTADSTPYGGLKIGSPSTRRPPPAAAAAGGRAPGVGGGGGDAGAVGLGGASAAQQSPGPKISTNGWPPMPCT